MLKYTDFLNIAKYGNENWKGAYSPEEVRQNAENYFSDYQWSMQNEIIAESISFLLSNFLQDWNDGNENVISWLIQLINDLKIVDMDFNDYEGTDELLVKFVREVESHD
jgi:hypothetical protein